MQRLFRYIFFETEAFRFARGVPKLPFPFKVHKATVLSSFFEVCFILTGQQIVLSTLATGHNYEAPELYFWFHFFTRPLGVFHQKKIVIRLLSIIHTIYGNT